jgi:hypothetical protein
VAPEISARQADRSATAQARRWCQHPFIGIIYLKVELVDLTQPEGIFAWTSSHRFAMLIKVYNYPVISTSA